MPNKNRKIHLILFFIVLGVFIWSFIKPKEGYGIWTLEVLPAVIGLIILVFTYKRFHFSTFSYLIVVILASMTFIGGHYTYDDVPLFDWLKDHFDLKRNHYDRFGHFLKGFIVIVIRELLLRKSPLKRGAWLVFITLSISLSIAAMYEIIEWVFSAIRTSGKESKEFLGMQGDMWDAQWDMALTLIGSIFALLLLSKLHNKFLKSFSR
jgi:putative membrane protein